MTETRFRHPGAPICKAHEIHGYMGRWYSREVLRNCVLEATVAGFPPISIRQPEPFDLVDDPVEICGVGTGFEAVFEARVRGADGRRSST